MSFSLRVANGDLCLQGSQLGIVYGSEKLKQDLSLWMAERFGVDRFHPSYGSYLENYIGGIIGANTRSVVQQEAMRILDNYQKIQYSGLQSSPTLYSLAEILYSINGVTVGLSYDTVSIQVAVSNAELQTAVITVSQGA